LSPELPDWVEEGQRYVQIAWPTAVLRDGDGHFRGFVMPKLDVEATIELEYMLQERQARAQGLPTGLGARVSLAANLAAVLAALHERGHYVVDLKPVNVRFYRRTLYLAMLDCDGFSIQGPQGHFPAPQFTPDYLAPEFQRSGIAKDGEAQQDRFALATVVFQLLNFGLHPYSGQPVSPQVPTDIPGRIAGRWYGYGTSGHDGIRPSPVSGHVQWPAELRAMFDRAFAGPDARRPSAAEWAQLLRPLAQRSSGRLVRCARKDEHQHFAGFACAACARDALMKRASAAAPSARAAPAVASVPAVPAAPRAVSAPSVPAALQAYQQRVRQAAAASVAAAAPAATLGAAHMAPPRPKRRRKRKRSGAGVAHTAATGTPAAWPVSVSPLVASAPQGQVHQASGRLGCFLLAVLLVVMLGLPIWVVGLVIDMVRGPKAEAPAVVQPAEPAAAVSPRPLPPQRWSADRVDEAMRAAAIGDVAMATHQLAEMAGQEHRAPRPKADQQAAYQRLQKDYFDLALKRRREADSLYLTREVLHQAYEVHPYAPLTGEYALQRLLFHTLMRGYKPDERWAELRLEDRALTRQVMRDVLLMEPEQPARWHALGMLLAFDEPEQAVGAFAVEALLKRQGRADDPVLKSALKLLAAPNMNPVLQQRIAILGARGQVALGPTDDAAVIALAQQDLPAFDEAPTVATRKAGKKAPSSPKRATRAEPATAPPP
jgi:hypothetical protein